MSFREPLDCDTGGYSFLLLPCNNCIGCRRSKAREWAFRCSLENQLHDRSCWVTLTYSDAYLPPTLRKLDLSAFIKRLRHRFCDRRLRFFGCGEYGEKTGRPHYHAILWGVDRDQDTARNVEHCWQQGITRVDQLSPAAISYVAGYTAKKTGRPFNNQRTVEYIDLDGNLQTVPYQDAFLQMSRNPGIGSHAREHTQSWRSHAIKDGLPMPVPRYLHQAWQKTATPEEIETLRLEKLARPRVEVTPEYLADLRLIDQAKQNLQKQKRSL